MVLYLQSRWKLEGRTLVYYGLRQHPNMFRNIRIKASTARLLGKGYTDRPIKGIIKKLYLKDILTEKENIKKNTCRI